MLVILIRLDYVSMMAQEHAYALAVENLLNLVVRRVRNTFVFFLQR